MKRLLVLSFYYEPDLSAGSFRTTAFVKALRERAPAETRIDVITTLPNRYSTFSQHAAEQESHDGVYVTRIALPKHRSDMIGQSQAFLAFARRTLRATAKQRYDLVFATSSRLLTATLGSLVARRTHAALYLDIRDIFVETITDVLPRTLKWPLTLGLNALESWTMRRANRINLVSPGFKEYFARRYPRAALRDFTNGIDDEFIGDGVAPALPPHEARRLTILYAGNIGASQGLHAIVPGLARSLGARARLVIIGDGGRRDALLRAVAGLDNVELRAPVARAELLRAYAEADVLFLHLDDLPAFERVLPSKLFEYGALGKPVLAGVGGYAARFVQEELVNAAVFRPCDAAAGVAAFESLRPEHTPRPAFIDKYSRVNIARRMADDVVALLNGF